MNIPQGYKQTELGIIPEDWEIMTFDELGTFSKGSGVSRAESNTGNNPCIRYGELYTHHNDYIKAYNSYISKTVASKAKLLQYGDVLFAASGETKEEIGKSAAFVNSCEAYAGGDIIILSTNSKLCDAKYIGYASNAPYVTKQKATKGQGDAVVHITSEAIKTISINIPPIAEQRAIAEALSDVDGLIAALDKKIAKKRLLKQGAMQQLLTGKKRLPGFTDKWGKMCFKSIYKFASEGGTPDTKNESFYANGNIPFVKIEDTEQKYIYSGKSFITQEGVNHSSAWLIPTNSIIFTNGATIGNVAINKIPVTTKQGILGIILNSRVELEFVYYLLSSSTFQDEVNMRLSKGTFATIILKHLDEIPINIPVSLKEQQAIATILSDMDKEIADLETQRDKYRLLKSGMMQKLLTGQIRLVKQQAKIIPLGVEVPVVREIPVATLIIAGHIVNRSHKSRGWGRTKLQKSLHLIGYCMQLNLGTEYIRNTAGPDDQQLMNHIDQKFRQYRHVNKVCEKLPDGRTHYSYTPTPMIQDVEMAYEKYPKELREQIDALIDKLNTMDLAGAEAVSTLYAVWNNRIIKQEQITDNLLIADFYAWSKHKADFEEARVRKALNYMRDNNIIPVGWGKYIDKR